MTYLKGNTTHPNDYSPGLIPGSDLEISTFGHMVEEEVEEVFGFLIFVSNDTTGGTLIHIQSLFTCDGVNANKRMLYLFDESRNEMPKQGFFGRLC
jgi:hypothetical protein